MKIDIWSDVACPWCYIGKRRFEAALQRFAHCEQVQLTWRSFQLDPDAPRQSSQTVNMVLARKYGMSLEQAATKNEQMAELAAQEGLEYHLEMTQYCNTFDAHRLIHFAAAHQMQDAMKERLLHAYFTEGRALGEIEELIRLGVEVGLDGAEIRAMLEGTAFADEVRADIRLAGQLGITGVPFFVLDDTYGISGAQPTELFRDALEQAWAESHPLKRIGTDSNEDSGACSGENCAI